MSEVKIGIETMLPKGSEVTVNGCEVVLDQDVHLRIKNASTIDQAAEFAHIHDLPCNFSHIDPESGVNVTYSSLDATRIETLPEPVAEKAKAKK